MSRCDICRLKDGYQCYEEGSAHIMALNGLAAAEAKIAELEAKLAAQRPVVEAAIAWRYAGPGERSVADALWRAVTALQPEHRPEGTP